MDAVLAKAGNAATLREIRSLVEKELGLPSGSCDSQKQAIKDRVMKFHDGERGKKRKNESDERLVKFKALARAMGAGPSVYKGFGNIDDEETKVSLLRERLLARGALIQGDLPTAKEISRAKAQRQRELDLDGIDTSNILAHSSPGRRRRRSQWD